VAGVKAPVLHAASADLAVVTATVEADTAVLAVELGHDAVSVEPLDGLDLTRRTARITLDGAPATRLDEGDDGSRLQHALDVAGLGLALDGVGAAAAALDLAVEYAKQREQFGVPIGSFQAVQHLCADMLRDVEMARLGCYYALWAGQDANDDFHRAATMAQAHAAEVCPHVAESVIQVFGGIGFTWEHDAHLYYRRVLAAAGLFGDADVHYAELARLVLD
jgi:alkylation response protein AidB-like acyl-CoA dehydrogenase